MFKNLIISIFTILITASYTLADPIPVFCLAGWIDACKGYSSATEYNKSAEKYTKKYNLVNNTINEYDNSALRVTKKYSLDNNTINEYDNSALRITKVYTLSTQ